ncbi:DUF6622 family protein [Ramlibacter sp.]|uniref:DUF6622 family protein n=1 Tax=Ramlibacter sp. TaxID=1917967 RepID=UPI002D0F14F8|nr:DUF6622 family protein [Ramlibacter sp.]HWI84450.1 DUF6622 family protein [Ramlibacter sp.]
MQLTPLIAIHMAAAIGALATGPVALWARRTPQRPRLHRAFGHAWVTLMIVTAASALFIRDPAWPHSAGLTPVHLLVPVTLLSLAGAFRALARHDIARHRWIMQRLYFGACIVAGLFALLPSRFLGHLLWAEWLGLGRPGAAGAAVALALPQIVARTPLWVWALLVALLVLGIIQRRQRTITAARALALPLGLTAFSLWGTLSAFGASPPVLLAWTAAAGAAIASQQLRPSAARYLVASRRFVIPGSWLPMLLMLGIFAVRYAVAASLAIRPQLGADAAFVVAVAALYGGCSGIFLGRTVQLARLALGPSGTGARALVS